MPPWMRIHSRAAFEPVARESVEVGAAGLSSSNLERFACLLEGEPGEAAAGGTVPLKAGRAVWRAAGHERYVRLRDRQPRRFGMSFPPFTAADFKVFEIEGFAPRMAAIKSRIRPKLVAAGRDLAPDVSRIGGAPAFAHVAKHARRTVNPPGDTWVAFAADKRGYKKHCHFKVAVSRGAVRFLFEAGPEHTDKKRWLAAWKRDAPKLVPVLRRAKGLAWFKNEHDDTPAAILGELSAEALTRLGEELTRARAGHFVLGRAVPAAEAVRWKPADYGRAARETFHLLAPLYRLR